MSFVVFAHWHVLVVIQAIIFEESLGIFNNTSVENRIVVSSPTIFYVNKNETGKCYISVTGKALTRTGFVCWREYTICLHNHG